MSKHNNITTELSPAGNIQVLLSQGGDPSSKVTAEMQQIRDGFEKGNGEGLLCLGASEIKTPLDPTLQYWQDFSRSFISKACATFDPERPDRLQTPDPDDLEFQQRLQAIPPMKGAEFITESLMHTLWSEVAGAMQEKAQAFEGGVQGYLKSQSAIWNVVGRVCLHLAENKSDPEFPFGFVATYAHHVSQKTKPQHLPLAHALKTYAGEKNKQKLVSLLAPLFRASQESAFMKELIDSRDIYHPLAFTAQQAHQFLTEFNIYQKAGLVVRMPDWWKPKNRPRPKVSVSVGSDEPSKVGMDALLDFNVGVTLGGETLTQQEIKTLMASSQGLVLLKGQWVEVDSDKLEAVLDHWKDVEKQSKAGDINFVQAMRLMSGAGIGLGPDEDEAEDDTPVWSEVVAGKWLSSKLEMLEQPSLGKDIKTNAGLKAKLREYQKVGVQWLHTLRTLKLGGCLADDMGLGKTIQVIGMMSLALKQNEAGTDLLIVPASILDNWQHEIKKFAPKLKVFMAHNSKMAPSKLKAFSTDDLKGYHAVITSYGTAMRLDWMKHHAWRNIILDEAQAIKNPDAKQTRAIKSMSSQWRLALTGTPVENRLGDLWSLFDFINPGLLGSGKAFADFSKSIANSGRGYGPLRRLVRPYILRRLKTDRTIISDLPDKTEVTAHCLLSKKQVALYQHSVQQLKDSLEHLDGIKRRGVILSFLMRFKQICNHPSQWLGDGEFKPTDSGKFARLNEICQSIAQRQDKVLVFTQFKQMTQPLLDFLSSVFQVPGLVLHGSTPVKQRQRRVEQFQEDENCPFMVLSLKAGGTGLNLTAASHVIHFDRWWNPAVENQATDRAFRIGQKKNVLVHKFVCQGTIEERIDALLKEKQKISDEILTKGADTNITQMSNEDLMSMVSLDINAAIKS